MESGCAVVVLRGGRQLFASLQVCLCRLVGSRQDRQWKESAGVSVAAQPMQDKLAGQMLGHPFAAAWEPAEALVTSAVLAEFVEEDPGPRG